MRAAWIGWGSVVFAVAGVGASILAYVTHPNPATLDARSHDLRLLLELDARLNEQMMKSRLGVVNHFDGLVRVDDQLRQVDARLDPIAAELGEPSREDLEAAHEEFREALAVKNELIEDFKSELAVLRNSNRAFPLVAERVRRSIGSDDVEEWACATDVEQTVLAAMISTQAEPRERAAEALSAHEPGGTCVSDDPAVRTMVAHGGAILERQPRVDSLVRDIAGVPTSARLAELHDRYTRRRESAEAAAQLRWVFAAAFGVIALLLAAGWMIRRLQQTAEEQRLLTDKLGEALRTVRAEGERERELAELKSRFVSMTSHEFRTPLSVILSSAELLEAYGDRWEPEKRRNHLSRIEESARGMSRMLDGVLLIGRADAGMLELKPAPLKLPELCRRLVDEVTQGSGDEARVELRSEGLDDDVVMDEKLLRHALTNLLSNALKYSADDTKVRFEVRSNGLGAIFEISDEGIGIPREDQRGLFEAFQRASNAGSIPGTGLGLAVVKRSVEAHRGKIELDSEVGKGTRFRLEMPYLEEQHQGEGDA